MSVNKVIILGRLGQDPELKYTPSGTAVCNFSVATSESWKDKQGNKQESTEWHRIVTWGKTAELCNQYLLKGRQVYLEGKLETRSWETQDGQKRYSTEIKANSIQFIGSRDSGRAANENKENKKQESKSSIVDQNYLIETKAQFTTDDIPF